MKKITLLILLILTASMVGFAQKDTSDLKTAISSNFPDNVAGFITPARLRAVSEDIMRSSANLLERNVFSEPLVVNDSIKADGFYRWTGADWTSVSDDTTAWARSGGFILPLDYTDKLSIDTGRVEGLLYPTGSVNLGTSSAPFDTINGNVMVATSLVVQACDSTTTGQVLSNTGGGVACWSDPCCTLDESYDSGGAGAGREIDAVDGAVKISGEDGLLITGSFGSGAVSEWSGSGTTMFFNPNKAAFRAGYVNGTQWDNASIGTYSIGLGRGVTASGSESTAMGNSTIASANESTAMGLGTTASGETSTAMGDNSTASGDISTAMGEGTTASGTSSTSIGSNTTASGDNSIAIGSSTTASGQTTAAIGQETTAKSYAETAIGLFNTDYTPTSTSTWEATDRLFVIGNGQSSGTRSDALVMLKDGSTTLNGSLAIIDGNEADGAVLTSDASGSATWQTPQETTLYSDVTEATTTTTDWETLATYNIAANTLSANGNSLEIHMAHVGAMPADSIRLVLGSTNVFLDNNAGQNNDNIKTTIARQSAGNQLFFTGNDFGTGTEDETTQLTLSFQAKSVTIGNQSLKYFKVKRSE